MALSPAATDNVLTVSQLNRLVKDTLEGTFPAVWVRGELSGFKRSDRGHLYFSLKDANALVDAVMWRTASGRLGFDPRDGTEVEAFGHLTVYEVRGRYQLVVQEMRPAGLGALLLALEKLKRKLQAEGLFDAARKRPLPPFPRRIGLVTSPSGAAVRDMVTVLRARWPAIGIVLAPVRVQGEGAAAEIAAAIARFNRYARVDLLIVGRGGGSLEDLWAFNEEPVVRAIAASELPVISAVGHEVDTTLADLVADVRAATPSNAAEIAVRDRREVVQQVQRLADRATRALRQGLADRRARLERLTEKYGFRRQRDALGLIQQRVDALLDRMRAALGSLLRGSRDRLDAVLGRYGLREWPRKLRERRDEIAGARERLDEAVITRAQGLRARLAALDDRLRALSPRSVLDRGFCIARAADGTLLRESAALAVGDVVSLEFARGEADARVESVRPGGNDGR
jgi:exodeoxyribonuclease VII large subunit